jgi:mRNA-degrading endonuclease RelE of RelBE toxin-antitoxin system
VIIYSKFKEKNNIFSKKYYKKNKKNDKHGKWKMKKNIKNYRLVIDILKKTIMLFLPLEIYFLIYV